MSVKEHFLSNWYETKIKSNILPVIASLGVMD